MENKLELIVKQSGLEQTKANFILEKFQNYFKIASEWEIKAKTIVVTNADQKTDMQIARVGRLFLRDKRIAIEKSRIELKEQSKREGKAIDGISNVLKALIVPIEQYLDKQEHYVEIQEKAKQEALRIEVEKKAEEERIAKEKAEAEAIEKQKLENIRLKKETEKKERQIQMEKVKAEKERREHEEKLRIQREEAQEAGRKQQEILLKQQQEAERKQKEIEEKARLEKERIEKEKENQRIEAEKKQKELQEKLNMITCPYCKKQFKGV